MTGIFDLSLILTGCVLLGVATELSARWWIRRRKLYFVLPPGLRLRMRPDPEVFPQLERATRFDVNRIGERGDDVPDDEPDLYRVLVAGGSQPEGFLLDQETAWPGALQQRLQRPVAWRTLETSRVHVGSIARSGVGSEGLDLIFKRILPRYPRLSLIIIMVGATDVLRWLEQGAPSDISPVRTADLFRCHPESTFGWTPHTLATGELLRRARRRWLRPLQFHDRAGHWIGKARAARARAEIIDTMPDPAPMLERFTRYFNRLLTRAAAHADRVLIVRQPWFDKHFTPEEAACMWHGGAGQAWREDVHRYYSFDVCSRLMRMVDRQAEIIADERGIQQLDLMPILERSLATYYDGFHVTPAGAAAVADAVADAVLHGCAAGRSAFRVPRSEFVSSEFEVLSSRI